MKMEMNINVLEELAKLILSLPLNPWMSEEDVVRFQA